MGVAVFVGGNGVGVTVGVTVSVTVGVAVGGGAIWSVSCKATYTKPAPMAKNKASKMIATGTLSVICGIRLPRTALAGAATSLVLLSSAPQTRQRVASSLTRVPQVGHNFVFLGELSVICFH